MSSLIPRRLELEQLGVEAARGQEGGVRGFFKQAAMLEDEDAAGRHSGELGIHFRFRPGVQRGGRLVQYWRAYELARRALELGDRSNLAALAYDRWLLSQGKPQKFGTQSRLEDGRWVMRETDPATTNAERAAWHVPPLANLERQIEARNRDLPSPPGDHER